MKRLAAYKFTLLSAGIVLTGLLLPAAVFQRAPVTGEGIDKIAHFAMFFIFSLSYLLEYKAARKAPARFLPASAVIAVFIVISEVLQIFTHSRHFDFADMAFDAAGAVFAFICSLLPSMFPQGKGSGDR